MYSVASILSALDASSMIRSAQETLRKFGARMTPLKLELSSTTEKGEICDLRLPREQKPRSCVFSPVFDLDLLILWPLQYCQKVFCTHKSISTRLGVVHLVIS